MLLPLNWHYTICSNCELYRGPSLWLNLLVSSDTIAAETFLDDHPAVGLFSMAPFAPLTVATRKAVVAQAHAQLCDSQSLRSDHLADLLCTYDDWRLGC